ncbi:MAG: ABC transporter ATP-binding protein/permease [Verrucomicrobiaceae bacterium]|nr:ABC transporter ATP-binding protein/permease [Verrucomicrobiaceae bacterium]
MEQQPQKKKKISRKDVNAMPMKELWAHTRDAVKGMARYLAPYKWRFMWGVVLGMLSGIFNMVILTGMQVVLSVVLKGETNELRTTSIPLFGQVNIGHLLHLDKDVELTLLPVVLLCLTLPVLFFIRGMLGYLANYLVMWVGNKILYTLRNDCFAAVLRQSIGYFHRAKIGDMIQTVFNQARIAQSNAVSLAQVLTQRPVAILAILFYLFQQVPKGDWPIVAFSLIILPLSIIPVVHIGRRVRKAGAAEEEQAGALMTTMHESFTGIRVVKSYAREGYEVDRFSKANAAMADNIMRWGKAMEIVGPVVESVASIGIAAGLVYAWHRGLEANQFFMIVLALTQIYAPAKDLSRVQLMLQKCIVATTAVFAALEERPEIEDAPDAKDIGRARGAITFRNIDFHYRDPGKRKIAKAAVTGINLQLEPGRFYALVGPSGAGKSTLFSLILRFYDPDNGSVELDGVDIRTITQASLRENIGVVSQDTFLFHDTIAENIRYGRLSAKEQDIIEAAKRAHAHEFIKQKKAGYQDVVGDSGNNLSGGQKQRISIARAILRNAPVLLLDEATSALDTESEKIIQEAIQGLSEGKTVIAIAHRLSTILEADQIVVMNQGRIEAVGSHHQLLQSSALYQRLYHLQYESGGENVEDEELAAVEA